MESDSSVINFMRIAWDVWPGSWHAYNDQVRQAAELCAAGFQWRQGDIDRLLKICRNGRCDLRDCLSSPGFGSLYTIAISAGNKSYCLEYERYANRRPIIVDNVNGRKRDRLCIGSKFEWKGERVEVTSFNKDGHAIACSRQAVDDYELCALCGHCVRAARDKIKHRYVISPAAVKAERKRQGG